MPRPVRSLAARLAAVLAIALAAVPAAAAPRAKGATGRTELTWYGQSAFVLRTPGGTVLAIDPWFANPMSPDKDEARKLERVDYILVTHAHPDHVGEAIALAGRTGAKLIAQSDLGAALVKAGYPAKQASFETLGSVGGVIQAGDATVTMVPAVHSSVLRTDAGPVAAGSPVGFVIRVKGGPTLYHTGDTDVTEDMRLIPQRYGRIDVMLACIGGHFTMDPRGAALAASLVKARTVVPMHYGTNPFLTGTPEELEAALAGKAKVLVLVPGKPATF